jgi:hypothetical protein
MVHLIQMIRLEKIKLLNTRVYCGVVSCKVGRLVWRLCIGQRMLRTFRRY